MSTEVLAQRPCAPCNARAGGQTAEVKGREDATPSSAAGVLAQPSPTSSRDRVADKGMSVSSDCALALQAHRASTSMMSVPPTLVLMPP